jgi:hypothetical protein
MVFAQVLANQDNGLKMQQVLTSVHFEDDGSV